MLIDNPTNLCWWSGILGFLLGFKGGRAIFCFVGVTTFGVVCCINSLPLTDFEATISVSGQSSSSWCIGKVGEQLHIEVERIRSTNTPILALISSSGILKSGIPLSSWQRDSIWYCCKYNPLYKTASTYCIPSIRLDVCTVVLSLIFTWCKFWTRVSP